MYKGIVKERSVQRKMFMFIVGAALFCVEFMEKNYLFMVILAILCLAIFFKKEHIVSEDGVEIRYQLLGAKVSYKWEWAEITAMRPDYKKAKPNIFMEIAKDVTIRAFVFTPEDAVGVMELAKKMNPDMYVDDRTEEQRREDEDERNRQIAEARMRQNRAKQEAKAKAKKRKKKK